MEDITKDLYQVAEEYFEAFLLLVPKLVVAIVVLVVAIFIAYRISRLVRKTASTRVHDQLLANFLGRLTKWTLFLAGFVLTMYILGLGGLAGGLVAGAGLSAFVVGFAFKDIAENFLAGVLLAFSRPYDIGDTVESNDIIGEVLALDMRTTRIKTFDGKDVYIPNAMVVKNPLVNFTKDGFIRYDFIVGIDYDDNISRVENLIVDSLKNVEGILTSEGKEPFVTANELATSTVNLKVHFWLDTFDYKISALKTQSLAIAATKEVLLENKIVMPADILELKVYNEKLPIPIKLIDRDLSNSKKEE